MGIACRGSVKAGCAAFVNPRTGFLMPVRFSVSGPRGLSCPSRPPLPLRCRATPGAAVPAAASGGGAAGARSAQKAGAGPRLWLSKKWLAPLFRGVHSSLAPTARPGSYARKPLLRKAFRGFDAHVAKSDQSLRGCGPRTPGGFSTDRGGGLGPRLGFGWPGGQRPPGRQTPPPPRHLPGPTVAQAYPPLWYP